jgi:large subunit ribosomal protein L15
MKLHDLRPAEGSTRPRKRVGRGIAAGQGKTAGRGTKGQKSRAGASIPAWFEGGQTPLHIRIPKLRGFRNINRIEYEVVNVGAISAAIERGRLPKGKGKEPVTVNADLLQDAGLVRNVRRPLKILGTGEVGARLFVVADAFTKSAREKIEAAGGTAQVIEIPSRPTEALGVEPGGDTPSGADAHRADEPRSETVGAEGTAASETTEPAAVADADSTADETAGADEGEASDADEAEASDATRAEGA